jgi:phenylacetate-CoA ligase
MTEIGPASYGYPDQPTSIYLLHSAYVCEVLQPGTSEAVSPGETGELVLTTLGRAACPLFRYRTGDLVRPVPVAGEEPAAFALDGGIIGRVDDMVVVRGVNLFPATVDAVVRAVPGIREYVAEIDRRNTLPEVTVRFETTDPDHDPSPELAQRLRDAFQLRISVEKVAPGVLPVFEMKARRWKILS